MINGLLEDLIGDSANAHRGLFCQLSKFVIESLVDSDDDLLFTLAVELELDAFGHVGVRRRSEHRPIPR